MSFMVLMIKLIKIKKRDITVIILNASLLVLFYYLLFEDSEIIYPLLLSGAVIVTYLIVESIKFKKFLEKLRNIKGSPNYCNDDTNFFEEEILDTINEIHHEYLNKTYTLNQRIKEKDALFSKWIHNMKTSITVIDLACENSIVDDKNYKYINDIKEENAILKKNLEECLNILRLEDFSRDYITSPCNLSSLVNEIINSKKRDFIYKKVFPKVEIKDSIIVYTDKKWCGYMLEQILSNSIKYSTKEKCNNIFLSVYDNLNATELIIRDEGIGIKKEDITRVFDPFFTGNNGRFERNSSGIGLYMVKVISNKLGHSVKIESEQDVGTTVRIIFKKENNVYLNR